MTKDTIALGVAVLALFVAFGAVVFQPTPDTTLAGLTHNQKESFMQGLFVGTSRQLDVQSDGDIVSEGNLVLTTSNAATSSLSVGCVGTYATSTATPIKFVFGTAFGTTTLPGNTVSNGLVAWEYGSCP